jgi:antitoxin YefM
MQSSYRLKANELDEKFIAGLKETYKDKDIEIIIYEVNETEYLLQSEVNKQRLMQAKINVDNKTNLVEIDLEDL